MYVHSCMYIYVFMHTTCTTYKMYGMYENETVMGANHTIMHGDHYSRSVIITSFSWYDFPSPVHHTHAHTHAYTRTHAHTEDIR